MLDYVIIKTEEQTWEQATRSDSITGLIVACPPISRPQMRVQIEEVDGRNGDIVTDLGYKAYDKPLTIGLYGGYDVDEVLGFFKRKGQIVFSDEPDRYHDYEIINQTDLQRVIQFRKGTVTFHVQPYKHLVNEPTLMFSGTGVKTVNNIGNTDAQPIISVTGTGTVNISINNTPVVAVALGSTSKTITIDSEALEAYSGDTLMNRSVTGDYDKIVFHAGSNTLSYAGSVTSLTVKNYTRWI